MSEPCAVAARFTLALLLTGVATTHAADRWPSPEAAYSLQARVYLQGDRHARASLAAMGPGWVPDERFDWQPALDDVPQWLGRQRFPPPSTAITQAFTEALAARLATVRCEARSFVPLGSPERGVFGLQCRYPDVSALRERYQALQAAPAAERQALSDALFTRWSRVLREAPDTVHCLPVTGWARADHAGARAARAEQLYQTVLMGLLPLDMWDAEEQSGPTAELCTAD